METQTDIQEISAEQWLQEFRLFWNQGEHVVILGPTGTGKTHFAQPIVDIREYVCVLALKPRDETLERFRDGHKYGYERYKIIKKFPPDYGDNRVIYWEKPEGLHKLKEQSRRVHTALNTMYREGGWTIFIDEAGYLAGTLGLGQAVGVLLNQGRSSRISVVLCVTRPTSVIARVPKEAFSQPRHKLIFKYENADEMKAAAQVADMSQRELQNLQDQLETHYPKGYTDFIYIGKGKTYIVRNKGEQ
jgi:energy-coupling factor transporter ATP-binding protein EcfA2